MAPVRPALPEVRNKTWVRTPVDQFILARLEKENLKASPEADKVTLIRRLSLDLIGLPPTLKEIDDFVADSSPHASQKLVERLLASEHTANAGAAGGWMRRAMRTRTASRKIGIVRSGRIVTG